MNFRAIINEEYDKVLIEKFFDEVEIYQSNHYGAYNRNRLSRAYHVLPDYFKKTIAPNPMLIKKLWRGADGIVNNYGAISFTDKRSNAAFYGTFAFPFSELQSYGGLIDTHKVVLFATKYKIPVEIGDDENEVIVIDPVWKPGLEDREENYRVHF